MRRSLDARVRRCLCTAALVALAGCGGATPGGGARGDAGPGSALEAGPDGGAREAASKDPADGAATEAAPPDAADAALDAADAALDAAPDAAPDAGAADAGACALFVPPAHLDAGPKAWSIAVGDFNGDGKPDLASASYGFACCRKAPLLVFEGRGDGTFLAPAAYPLGPTPALVVADFDGDGRDDVAAATGDGRQIAGSVQVLLSRSHGTLAAAVATVMQVPDALAVGDLDGDGKPDLAVGTRSGSSGVGGPNGDVTVLRNAGGGALQQGAVVDLGGRYVTAVAVADLDGDGKQDIVALALDALGGDSGVFVLRGHGDGTFDTPSAPVASVGDGHALAVADLDGDGKLDVAFTDFLVGVTILRGHGDGTFTTGATYPTTDTYSVVAADLDGDGHVDLAAGGSPPTVLLGAGDGTFRSAAICGGSGPMLAARDLDGDGRPDLALGSVDVLLGRP